MSPHHRRLATVFSCFCLAWILPGSLARADVSGEAYSAKPFGIARSSFSGADVGSIDERLVRLEEKGGRVFYPVKSTGFFG